jgi:hypothetical protein
MTMCVDGVPHNSVAESVKLAEAFGSKGQITVRMEAGIGIMAAIGAHSRLRSNVILGISKS